MRLLAYLTLCVRLTCEALLHLCFLLLCPCSSSVMLGLQTENGGLIASRAHAFQAAWLQKGGGAVLGDRGEAESQVSAQEVRGQCGGPAPKAAQAGVWRQWLVWPGSPAGSDRVSRGGVTWGQDQAWDGAALLQGGHCRSFSLSRLLLDHPWPGLSLFSASGCRRSPLLRAESLARPAS